MWRSGRSDVEEHYTLHHAAASVLWRLGAMEGEMKKDRSGGGVISKAHSLTVTQVPHQDLVV